MSDPILWQYGDTAYRFHGYQYSSDLHNGKQVEE